MSASTTEIGLSTVATDRSPANVAQRDLSFDSLRGIAILMVIGIHSLHQPLDAAWATAVDAMLRPAVPLFLFASGYLSARTRRIPILKRLRAVLIPYAIAFVAAYLYMAINNPEMDHRPWVALARFCLGYVLVYYYVPVYIGCTLVLWLIFRLCERTSQEAERKLAIVLALAILPGLLAGSYLDPLLSRLGASNSLIEEARLRDLPFWFAFMSLGVLTGLLHAERPLTAMVPLLAACTLTAYAIYAAVRIASLGDAAAYDSIALFVYAALLCLMFLAAPLRNTLLGFVGSGSYFIYLWHILAIMWLRDQAVWQHTNGALASVATFAAAAVTTIAALAVIRSALPARAAQWLGA
ncbi:acyltransferase [Bradyrhizobium sp. LHD-71]|uniref:acyltransferase n=1 Tax=Bradyrhizobium sp. LHD-71 TaxID=3072141 RepID=UPI00280C89D7|nr:acyltransferase [Bradyrhizobium sp. LHD-71]MDQ8729770.1 acyltransferase [Bradyrhizobium sp. LHD-71]